MQQHVLQKLRPLTLGMVVAASLAATTAQAGFGLADEPAPTAAPTSQNTAPVRGETPRFEVIGEAPLIEEIGHGEAVTLDGFGRDVTVRDALKQIAPAGWRAFADKRLGARMDQRLDWRGDGRPWTASLRDVARSAGLTIRVDWPRHYLFLVPAVTPEVSLADLPAAKAVSTQPVVPTWSLQPGKTVQANLAIWAQRAGWQMAWDATVDYPVDLAASFQGDFVSAVKQLVTSYQEARVPLRVGIYNGNRVIRITSN